MNVSLFLLYCGPSCPDISQQQEKQEDTLDTKLRDDFGPELDKIAKALSVVVGFESFGDYVFHCVRRDVTCSSRVETKSTFISEKLTDTWCINQLEAY